jgi:hypothetical protein
MELIVSLIEADSTADSVSSRTLKAQDVSILPNPDRCEDTTRRGCSVTRVFTRAQVQRRADGDPRCAGGEGGPHNGTSVNLAGAGAAPRGLSEFLSSTPLAPPSNCDGCHSGCS